MKKMMSLIASMFIAMAANAQAPQMLGENNAMQRIEVKSQFLLLPVQEKEENANIQVIVDNVQRQTLNVKLAVDKVDYYVPLDIKRWGAKSVLLDITFHGDRRATGAIKDFACWKEMKQTDRENLRRARAKVRLCCKSDYARLLQFDLEKPVIE